jgi:hypothetical protein
MGSSTDENQNMAEDGDVEGVQEHSDEHMDDSGGCEDISPMDTEGSSEYEMKQSSSLQMMLSSIAEERNKEHSSQTSTKLFS